MPRPRAPARARVGGEGDEGGGSLPAATDRAVDRGDPPAQPAPQGGGLGRRAEGGASGLRRAAGEVGVAGAGGAGLRDIVGAPVESPGAVVHVPESSGGGADQL